MIGKFDCLGNNSYDSIETFRDPAGYVFRYGKRILRVINDSGIEDFMSFMSSNVAKEFLLKGKLVKTTVLDSSEADKILRDTKKVNFNGGLIVEHECIEYQSFPYEWPPEMLHDAGCLTIDLAEKLLDEGFGIKDATPYNILFNGPKPVFVDLLSFEKRDPRSTIWLPYNQFVQTFLLPLLVNKCFKLPIDKLLLNQREGLDVREVYHLCSILQKFSPLMLTMVTIPALLTSKSNQSNPAIYEVKIDDDINKVHFVLKSLFKNIRKALNKLAPEHERKSLWTNYMLDRISYTTDSFDIKQNFIQEALDEFKPKKVLDIGCNTGYFSTIAAKSGASVVAIDYDPTVVGKLWRKAFTEDLDILPLVVNIAQPSPGTGWRNQEYTAFLERMKGSFNAVFMLALIHHIVINDRIPLTKIIHLAAELTTDILVAEFIATDDPMFRSLTRGRDLLYSGFTQEFFENTCQKHFDIIRSKQLKDDWRCMYLLRKKRQR